MGCCHSRTVKQCPLNEVEDMIGKFEDALGFNRVSAEEVKLRLTSYWPRATVSRKIILRMLEKQEVHNVEIRLQKGTLAGLFEYFREGREYSIRKIVLLAIMLSSDSVRMKAGLMFAMYHGNDESWMGVEDANELIKDATDIALNFLPRYVQSEYEEIRDEEGTRKMSRLMSLLMHGKDFLDVALRRDLKGSKELSEAEFIQKLTKEPATFLCSARMMRTLAYNKAIEKRIKTIELENRLMDEDDHKKMHNRSLSSTVASPKLKRTSMTPKAQKRTSIAPKTPKTPKAPETIFNF